MPISIGSHHNVPRRVPLTADANSCQSRRQQPREVVSTRGARLDSLVRSTRRTHHLLHHGTHAQRTPPGSLRLFAPAATALWRGTRIPVLSWCLSVAGLYHGGEPADY